MSEINSIANGTFTIGQTSATNFVAGPGIKIDEPSAGTVRIGTDETVLWESTNATGTNLTNVFNLSESMGNFNKVKVVYRLWNDGFMPNWFEFDYNNREGNSTKNICDVFTLNPLRFIGASFNFSANNSFVVNEIRYADGSFATQTLDKTRGAIYKVIGINRINA